jgi:hypothetical protein
MALLQQEVLILLELADVAVRHLYSDPTYFSLLSAELLYGLLHLRIKLLFFLLKWILVLCCRHFWYW